MSTMEQGLGDGDEGLGLRRICAAGGCTGEARGDARFCARCGEEIAAMIRAGAERHARVRARTWRRPEQPSEFAGRWAPRVKCALDTAVLLIAVVGVMFLSAVFAVVVLQWLGWF